MAKIPTLPNFMNDILYITECRLCNLHDDRVDYYGVLTWARSSTGKPYTPPPLPPPLVTERELNRDVCSHSSAVCVGPGGGHRTPGRTAGSTGVHRPGRLEDGNIISLS